MKNKIILLSAVAIIAILAIGCGTTPTPTPLPTQPPIQVTVVVTATLPPPTATSPLPTMTAIPTVALTTTLATATPVTVAQATAKPATVKPAATKTPTKVAATATVTAVPIKYGAAVLTSPIWANKDERRWPADDLIFRWRPVGGLQGDECYLLKLTTEAVNPGPGIGTGGDYFITNCGDPSGISDKDIQFTLFSPKRGGPNYGSVSINTDMWVHWSITVVKKTGQCEANNPYHCKYVPISPTSTDYFRFIGS